MKYSIYLQKSIDFLAFISDLSLVFALFVAGQTNHFCMEQSVEQIQFHFLKNALILISVC